MNNTIETVVVATQSTFDLGLPDARASVQPLATKTGKVTGTRFLFQQESLADFKSRLVAAGFSAAERRVRVQSWFRGDGAARANMEAAALVSALQAGGFVAEKADVRASSASLRFVKAPVEKIKSPAGKDAEIARLKAELAALKAAAAK
jgi:glutathione S-transferase